MINTAEKLARLREYFKPLKQEVKMKAEGLIKHDFLAPAPNGPYRQQWDWDAFFMGISLMESNPPEAVYLKYWAMNYLDLTDETGYTPGMIMPEAIGKTLFHIKPLIAQGAYFASSKLGDFSWIEPYFDRLEKAVLYREKYMFSEKYGLTYWHDGFESGADNNPALIDYPEDSVLAADANAFLYRDYIAMAKISQNLGRHDKEKEFLKRAEDLKLAIEKYLWNDEDETYYNLYSKTGALIKRHTYSNMLPLFAEIAENKKAENMIKKYILNPEKMWSKYGYRSLAKDDRDYNQANIIKPYSNWQGPVWPVANYICMQALLNYGFKKEAGELADKMVDLCLTDLDKNGMMHENYDAETGEPLAAPNFISWNLLVEHMHENVKNNYNPLKL